MCGFAWWVWFPSKNHHCKGDLFNIGGHKGQRVPSFLGRWCEKSLTVAHQTSNLLLRESCTNHSATKPHTAKKCHVNAICAVCTVNSLLIVKGKIDSVYVGTSTLTFLRVDLPACDAANDLWSYQRRVCRFHASTKPFKPSLDNDKNEKRLLIFIFIIFGVSFGHCRWSALFLVILGSVRVPRVQQCDKILEAPRHPQLLTKSFHEGLSLWTCMRFMPNLLLKERQNGMKCKEPICLISVLTPSEFDRFEKSRKILTYRAIGSPTKLCFSNGTKIKK